MKFFITRMTLLPAALSLLAGNLQAQTITNLHTFGAAAVSSSTGLLTNGDGAYEYSPLTLSGNTLYGVSSGDNSNGLGGVFRINTDGTAFTNLFAFGFITGGDNGSGPFGALALSGNTLYGTTQSGGTNFNGSIFAINTDGTGFTNLHYFSALVTNTNADGKYPKAGVVLSGDMLYGTALAGGTNGDGTIFAMNTNGTGFTNLFNFAGINGQNPEAGLVVSGSTLYGTTSAGGIYSDGTIFAINTDGTGFVSYHSFTALGSPYPTNSDGANPEGGLALSGGILYGTTESGGELGFGYGTIFAINANGTGFTNLLDFNYTDGYGPMAGLLVTNNTLYGTTSGGGANYSGTVFSATTNGTGWTDLYDFPLAGYSGSAYTNSEGATPSAGVVMSGNTLFGVTPIGGSGGVGTVYGFILAASAPVPIPLIYQVTGDLVILSWSDPRFSLQSTVSLGVPFSDVPGATSPYTFSSTNAQQFFRLVAN
jgi:uncharacterized repeat protein (TIGR03803 family)